MRRLPWFHRACLSATLDKISAYSFSSAPPTGAHRRYSLLYHRYCPIARLFPKYFPKFLFGEEAGKTFLKKSFPCAPFKRLFEQGLGGMLTRSFTVSIVGKWVCALDDWRSRPTVALRVRLRASPSAQDDTKGRIYAILTVPTM